MQYTSRHSHSSLFGYIYVYVHIHVREEGETETEQMYFSLFLCVLSHYYNCTVTTSRMVKEKATNTLLTLNTAFLQRIHNCSTH